MTNTEKVVNVVVNDIKKELSGMYKDYGIASWQDMLDAFGQDSEDFKEDVLYTLKNSKEIDTYAFTDECEIIEDDGHVTTYRQLTNKIRKALGW